MNRLGRIVASCALAVLLAGCDKLPDVFEDVGNDPHPPSLTLLAIGLGTPDPEPEPTPPAPALDLPRAVTYFPPDAIVTVRPYEDGANTLTLRVAYADAETGSRANIFTSPPALLMLPILYFNMKTDLRSLSPSKFIKCISDMQGMEELSRVLDYSLRFYLQRMWLIALFSIPFLFAFAMISVVAAPTYMALGGLFSRTGSIPELSLPDIAVIAIAYAVSFFIIADAVTNVNLIIRSQRTLTIASREVIAAMGRHAIRIFYIYTIMLLHAG